MLRRKRGLTFVRALLEIYMDLYLEDISNDNSSEEGSIDRVRTNVESKLEQYQDSKQFQTYREIDVQRDQ